MAVEPSRSWGSKGLRMVNTFEEWTAWTAEIGGIWRFPRIDTENLRDLRGENQPLHSVLLHGPEQIERAHHVVGVVVVGQEHRLAHKRLGTEMHYRIE